MCIFAIFVAWVCDKTSSRVLHHVLGVQYAILTLLTSGTEPEQLLVQHQRLALDAQLRCLGLALAVGGPNLGGLAGQNISVKIDTPYYHNGFLKVLCLYLCWPYRIDCWHDILFLG